MDDKQVIEADAGAPAPPPAVKPESAVPTAADFREQEKQLVRLREQVETSNNAAIHWHEAYQGAAAGVNGNGKGNGKVAEGAIPEGDDDDVIDAITSKGWKAIEARVDRVLKTKNFLKADEFDSRTDARIGAMSAEMELRKQYPQLEDRDSPLFEETARQYKELEGVVTGPKRLTLAAQHAELALRKAGKWSESGKDEDRQARGRAQGGEPAGRRGPKELDEEVPMTAGQKKLCEELGVSEEAYQKRAKEGFRMSSFGGRR